MKDAERRLLEMIFGEKPEFVLELITDLDRGLQSRRPEYYRQLQPGVTYEMLDDFERQVSLKLPNSFRTLYQWKNGQHPDCDEPIEDNRVWMPLEDIIATKDMLDGMIGYDFTDPNWWRREWVPFLSNRNGDHLCLDLTTVDGEIPAQVIAFWHDWDDRSTKHPSLKVWLNRLVASMNDESTSLPTE